MDQYNNTVTLYDESTGEYYTIEVENEDRKYEIENSNR
jgi:hypothetical protein